MSMKLNFMHATVILQCTIDSLCAGTGVIYCLDHKKSIEKSHSMAIDETRVTRGFNLWFRSCFYVSKENDPRVILDVKTSKKMMKIFLVPSTFVMARSIGNVILFYYSRVKKIIISWYHNHGLESVLAKDLGQRLHLAFDGKRTLKRSPKQMGVGGMIGGDGYKSRFKLGKDRVEFFTYAVKLGNIIGEPWGIRLPDICEQVFPCQTHWNFDGIAHGVQFRDLCHIFGWECIILDVTAALSDHIWEIHLEEETN